MDTNKIENFIKGEDYQFFIDKYTEDKSFFDTNKKVKEFLVSIINSTQNDIYELYGDVVYDKLNNDIKITKDYLISFKKDVINIIKNENVIKKEKKEDLIKIYLNKLSETEKYLSSIVEKQPNIKVVKELDIKIKELKRDLINLSLDKKEKIKKIFSERFDEKWDLYTKDELRLFINFKVNINRKLSELKFAIKLLQFM